MSASASPAALYSSYNNKSMAKTKKKNSSAAARSAKTTRKAAPKTPKSAAASPPPKTSPREKLRSIKPSGEQDDSFFDLVHAVARQIPPGRVTSYGAIAASL